MASPPDRSIVSKRELPDGTARKTAILVKLRTRLTIWTRLYMDVGFLVFGLAGLLTLVCFMPPLAGRLCCPIRCCWPSSAVCSASSSTCMAGRPAGSAISWTPGTLRDLVRDLPDGVPAGAAVRDRAVHERAPVDGRHRPHSHDGHRGRGGVHAGGGRHARCHLVLRAGGLPAAGRHRRHHRSGGRGGHFPRSGRAQAPDHAGRRREPVQRRRVHRPVLRAAGRAGRPWRTQRQRRVQ